MFSGNFFTVHVKNYVYEIRGQKTEKVMGILPFTESVSKLHVVPL